MSIVPKEVVDSIMIDSYGESVSGTLAEAQEKSAFYIANRAAEWALQQAVSECKQIADSYSNAITRDGTEMSRTFSHKHASAMQCYYAIRALLKGGESDGQG